MSEMGQFRVANTTGKPHEYFDLTTTRRECLDFLIPLSAEHLRRLLTE